MTEQRFARFERILLITWVVINLGIGLLIVRDYGLSFDEPNNYRYANDALDAYPSFFGMRYEPNYDSSYDGHGPAFLTLTLVLIKIIQGIFPNVFTPDLWHFSYFITFQLTGLCLYWLAKRWFSIWTSWGILILFTTQPLLWGHAFINPKDIPFMFFFTLSTAFGFRLADSIESTDSLFSLEEFIRNISDKFLENKPRSRKRFLILFVLALSVTLILILFSHQINFLLEQIVAFFYSADPSSWAGRIFNSFAIRASDIPLDDYVTKVLRIFHRAERYALIVGICFFFIYFGFLIGKKAVPAYLQSKWKQVRQLGKNVKNFDSVRVWFTDFFQALRNPYTVFAGIALGLATAVRAIAPITSVIVFIYLYAKVRSKAWAIVIAYFLIAGIITFLAWPHLWEAPITRFLESLGIASNFPWKGRVLFNNRFYRADELPRSYLPVLFNIQLTEPMLLLFYVGLGLLIWRLLRDRLKLDLLLYIGFGSIFPLAGLVVLNPPLYDNFRQLLFLLPGIFLLTGFALEAIFNKLRQHGLRLVLIIVMCLPGLTAIVRLHPYQYVYYNSLVGGVGQASTRFEMDYWRISMREMALDLNKIAEPGARVIVVGAPTTIEAYIRPDIIIEKYQSARLDLNGDYDYAILPSRWNALEFYPNAEIISSVERQGAVLAVIKRVKGENFK